VNERTPTEAQSSRMAPLARLPLFYALEGKRALVSGGTAAATWKAELLSAAGARVDVYAEHFGEEMSALALDPPRGSVVLHARNWLASDFAAAAIAIGACEDEASAAAFASAAREAGVPVNVIDRPAFCDFAFGAIVNRSPMVIGISTDGAAPVFAQAIRAKLEAMLPKGFAAWAAAAQSWRALLRASDLAFAARRKFWEVFTAHAVSHPQDVPTQSDFASFFATAKDQAADRAAGSVTLVGAGPGDPELLTLRAVRALQSADVILFDDLVSRDVLDFARREAKKMLVGKTGFGPSCRQDDINRLMVGLAKQGKRVVRLKGGDPLIFGRANEEIEACADAGIAVEIVPGITAAQGAAATLPTPLTGRGRTRRLQYVTGHSRDGALPELDWKSIADPSTTTAIYMPTRTLEALVSHALAAGLDAKTPAIAISRATRADQQVIRGAIGELPRRMSESSLPGPVLVMIGVSAESAASAATEPATAAAP
jgi:uroporphyrin-III C-methyltransferase / precorrin-2 dehydrogenase / sirohydrochlorin ferrochelatase